jgi:heme oxygenase
MPLTINQARAEEQSRAKRLKATTRTVHEGVDHSIMAAAAFDTIGGYKRFLAIQYRFHRDVAALYADLRFQAVLPDLVQRSRLPLIMADMTDLGLILPDAGLPAFAAASPADRGTAMGWLYVAEGSNMGAALLRKEAQKLGLTDSLGARHLAPAPEGPAAHWRTFTAALDRVALTDEEEKQAGEGALEAFARVQAHIDAYLD